MASRSIERSIELLAGPNQVFDLLITPSAVRQWWQASQVIIVPRTGGVWVASWGEEEDHPEYVTAHRIVRHEPPHLLQLIEVCYYARATILPFETELITTFEVEQLAEHSRLTVRQEGFPSDAEAEEFYEACNTGWNVTLENIRAYVDRGPSEGQ